MIGSRHPQITFREEKCTGFIGIELDIMHFDFHFNIRLNKCKYLTLITCYWIIQQNICYTNNIYSALAI